MGISWCGLGGVGISWCGLGGVGVNVDWEEWVLVGVD